MKNPKTFCARLSANCNATRDSIGPCRENGRTADLNPYCRRKRSVPAVASYAFRFPVLSRNANERGVPCENNDGNTLNRTIELP